jgi:YD repeat-containing protein
LNQVTSHILPSGAIETYVYDANTHLLIQEYNSVDGTDARKEYTYDSLGRVATMIDGRARASGAAFTVRMTYNGRHQVLAVEYAAAHAPYPTVRYEYDKYGNCITITDELANRKEYTYDAYRRCTSYREWLLAPAWNGSGTVVSRQWDWIYDREVEGIPAQFSMRVASSHTSKEWRIQVEPVFNSAGERRATSRTFDVNNRIMSEQTGQIQLSTEPVGTLHAGLDAETHRFTYDQNGQKKTYKDERQRLTTYQYDNRNRLWKTTEDPAPGSSGTSRTTETRYDGAWILSLVYFRVVN